MLGGGGGLLKTLMQNGGPLFEKILSSPGAEEG
jgi:hypothetical protein